MQRIVTYASSCNCLIFEMRDTPVVRDTETVERNVIKVRSQRCLPKRMVVASPMNVKDALEFNHSVNNAAHPARKGILKMNQKLRLWTVFVLFGISLMTSSNAWGEHWNRAVKNSSSKPVTITVDAGHGNVWFSGACNTENGPCTIPPGETANTTFTTTAGWCNGTFKFKHGTAPECTCTYFGGTQSSSPAVRFMSSTCPSNIKCNLFTTTDQWWGYVEVMD